MILHSYSTLILTIFMFLASTNSQPLRFSISLEPSSPFCMNQILKAQQRYQISVLSATKNIFQVHIGYSSSKKYIQLENFSSLDIQRRQQNQEYDQSENNFKYSFRANKLAAIDGTYSFCINNKEQVQGIFNISYITGAKSLELTELPDLTDAENMDREIDWLDQNLDQLEGRLFNMQELRISSNEIHDMIGSKIIVFAILGLMIIAIVNIVFYRSLKEQLRKRKLI